MWNYLGVAAGGAIGCCLRYGMTQLIQTAYGRSFPLATLIVNVAGCFLMGFLFFYTLERAAISPALRAAILAGGLGGFTTFSTFALEGLLLMEDGERMNAFLYLALSLILGLAAAYFGALIARKL
jgi:CrcB protein